MKSDDLYAVVIEPREFLVEIYARREIWQPLRSATLPEAPTKRRLT